MSVRLFETFQPPDAYQRAVNYAASEASSDHYRLDTVDHLLTQAVAPTANPAKRYRIAFDALHLLSKRTPVSVPSDPTNLQPLKDALAVLENMPVQDAAMTARAKKTVEEISRTTWSSFEAMCQSEFGQNTFDAASASGLNAFRDWFRAALPYVGLELDDEDEKATRQAAGRIKFLTDKLATSSTGDKFGEADRYTEEAWQYLKLKWSARKDVRQTQDLEALA